MARYSNVQTDFSGGLISDYVVGRTDIKRVANSGRKFKNFFPSLQGPAIYRTGFKHYNTLAPDIEDVLSVDVILATDVPYRAVFSPTQVEIFDSAGVSKDVVTTEYSASDIKDLRFSSETGELYIAHGRHKPKKLTADITFVSQGLVSSDGFTLFSTAGYGIDTTFDASEGYTAGFVASSPFFEGQATTGSWEVDPTTGKISTSSEYKLIRTSSVVAATSGQTVLSKAQFDFGTQTLSTNNSSRMFTFSLMDIGTFPIPNSGETGHFSKYPHISFSTKFSSGKLKLFDQANTGTALVEMNLSDLAGDTLEAEIQVNVGTTAANTGVVVTLRSITDSTSVTHTQTGVPAAFYTALLNQGVKAFYQSGSLTGGNVDPLSIHNIFFRNQTTFGTSTTLELRANAEVQGDDQWTLEDLKFDVEPFLEKQPESNKFNISQNERYIKLETPPNTTDFSPIVQDFTRDNADPSSSSFSKEWYVEYVTNGDKFLGKVVHEGTTSNYTLADPADNAIYVEPVISVLNIEDNAAQLFLLDNEETSNSTDVAALKFDGVLEDTIVLRSDTTIFNGGFVNSWVRVGDDRRNNDVVVGHTRDLTRWVKIKEHLGTEDHPVEFNRGVYDNTQYSSGSVYRVYGPLGQTSYMLGPKVDGNIDQVMGIIQPTGTRTFSFVNRLQAAATKNAALITDDTTIGNLSTQKQFDAVSCYNNTDDSIPKVEEYDASENPTGNLLIPEASSAVTITTIANDAFLNSTEDTFSTSDTSRHIFGIMESGNVYMKVVRTVNNRQVVVKLLNEVPRDKRTLSFENAGNFEAVKLGAWYSENYPRTVAKFEQRRIFGGTYSNPNFMYFSRADDEASFQPTQNDGEVLDTDAITYALSNRNAGVRWINAAKDLVIGTTGGIYRIVPNQYQYGISPKTVRMELTEEEPCEQQAETVASSVFYPDQSGTRLMEYKYDQSLNNSSSNDVSKLVYPIFLTDAMVQIAYQHTPQPRIWARTASGKIYCLSYHRQEEFYAWSEQDLGSDAKVLDISILHRGTGSELDQVWIVVKRSGSIHTEALAETDPVQLSSYPMLDSYVELIKPQSGNIVPDVSTRYGAGDTVAVIEDGVYTGEQTLTDGTVTLQSATAERVVVGLRYTGELQMMFPTWDGQNRPAYSAETARIVSLKAFFINSFSFMLGIKDRFNKVTLSSGYGAGNGFTGFDKERPVAGSTFGADNVPTIKHEEPYPLTIASITTKTDLN
jgi:hypothetical protein